MLARILYSTYVVLWARLCNDVNQSPVVRPARAQQAQHGSAVGEGSHRYSGSRRNLVFHRDLRDCVHTINRDWKPIESRPSTWVPGKRLDKSKDCAHLHTVQAWETMCERCCQNVRNITQSRNNWDLDRLCSLRCRCPSLTAPDFQMSSTGPRGPVHIPHPAPFVSSLSRYPEQS